MSQGDTEGDQPAGSNPWVRRVIIAVLVIVAIAVIYLLLQTFLPRWWAHRIGRQVEGATDSGVMWGGFYGFVFTAIPLLMIAQARRGWVHWQGRIFLVVAALLIATPNWLTLVVVTGNSSSASTGRSTMDVYAPGFRLASLVGVIAGFIIIGVFYGGRWLLARRKRQIAELRRRLDDGSDS